VTVKDAARNYHARMQRVLDHIDGHAEDELPVEALSAVAAFSKYHFHRQFSELLDVVS
jgi:AraC family transcriptional regulator